MKYLRKYERFVQENENENDFSFLLNDCMPFIELLRKNRDYLTLLYHNTRNSYINDEVKNYGYIKLPHKDRIKPRDTDIRLHELMSDLFLEKFSWNPRVSSIFCHNNLYHEKGAFGKQYIILPVGEFKYVWSPKIADPFVMLWGTLNLDSDETRHNYVVDEDMQKARQMITDYVDSCIDTDFDKYLISKNEIMIHAEAYYLIDYSYVGQIRDMIYEIH
jgi:hypothetical protein